MNLSRRSKLICCSPTLYKNSNSFSTYTIPKHCVINSGILIQIVVIAVQFFYQYVYTLMKAISTPLRAVERHHTSARARHCWLMLGRLRILLRWQNSRLSKL